MLPESDERVQCLYGVNPLQIPVPVPDSPFLVKFVPLVLDAPPDLVDRGLNGYGIPDISVKHRLVERPSPVPQPREQAREE